LSQALPAPKQLNLNKLSDADGSQIQWLTTPSETDFSGCLCICRLLGLLFGVWGEGRLAGEGMELSS